MMHPIALSIRDRLRLLRRLACGSALFVVTLASAVAAPPIEALQRSVQQRWLAVSNATQAIPTTFPLRSDGVQPGFFPADGFYGSDLDDPSRLSALVGDLEGKVGWLADRYTLLDTIEGAYGYRVVTGGVYHFDTAAVPDVARVLAPSPTSAPIAERVEWVKNALLMIRIAPVEPSMQLVVGGTTTNFAYYQLGAESAAVNQANPDCTAA